MSCVFVVYRGDGGVGIEEVFTNRSV